MTKTKKNKNKNKNKTKKIATTTNTKIAALDVEGGTPMAAVYYPTVCEDCEGEA